MDFGPLPTSDVEGCVLGHTLRLPGGVFKKGRVLTAPDVGLILMAGHTTVVVARLGTDDVIEGVAAHRLARSVCGAGVACGEPFTGRANLHATTAGILDIDEGTAMRLLDIDEALTLATLAPGSTVSVDQLVATAKVIPFAVPGALLADWEALAASEGPCLSVKPFSPHAVTFIQTRLPGTPEGVLDRASASMHSRLAARGSTITAEVRCKHDGAEVARHVRAAALESVELVIILGASQIADRADVVPSGIVEAGGTIHRFGLPVDPGNLTLIASLGAVPVLGVPGCARSLRPSGFDHILDRVLIGTDPSQINVTGLGVGGLLKEIASRPQPRRGPNPDAVPGVASDRPSA